MKNSCYFLFAVISTTTALLTVATTQAATRASVREFAGLYAGTLSGSFEGRSASDDATVRLPAGRGRITVQGERDGFTGKVNGRITRFSRRASRIIYWGKAETRVAGVRLSGSFRAVATRRARAIVLRIPLRLDRRILGERLLATGRFIGTKPL